MAIKRFQVIKNDITTLKKNNKQLKSQNKLCNLEVNKIKDQSKSLEPMVL